MDYSQPKYRINGEMMPKFSGKQVCMLGIATNVDRNGTSFQMKTPDDKTIQVQTPDALQEYVNGLVEVHGIAQQDGSILCHNYVLFSPENTEKFDMNAYNAAVGLIHTAKEHYTVPE